MYTELSAALTRAKERSGATEADDEYLAELLELSAGTAPDGVTHYRPFVCAARWIEQNASAQTLLEAEGVKFTGLAKPIESLLQMQAAYDQALQLTVPPGFEVVQVAPASRHSTRSHSPKILP